MRKKGFCRKKIQILFFAAIMFLVILPAGIRGIRGADGNDVTNNVEFTNGVLKTGSAAIDPSQAYAFSNATYSYTIEWKANPPNMTFSAGDHVTFSIKTYTNNALDSASVFKNLTLSVFDTLTNQVWGTVKTDANGNGTITFNENVEGKQNLAGKLSFYASYSHSAANEDIKWEFSFGDTYTYSGTSKGTTVTGPNSNTRSTTKNSKTGGWSSAGTDGDIYYWQSFFNIAQDAWAGKATISDDIPAGFKTMTWSTSFDTNCYGYYGTGNYSTANAFGTATANRANYYFAIAVIDWNRMRQDYNALVQDNTGNEYLWVDGVETVYKNSGPITDTYTYSSYMMDKMYSQRVSGSSGPYKYLSPYTGGLESVTVTDGKFEIVFPNDALNGKSIRLYFYTQLTTPLPNASYKNTINVTGAATVSATTSSISTRATATISGNTGQLTVIKTSTNETTRLVGVPFELSKNGGGNGYPIIETTNDNGVLAFTLQAPYAGEYTLTELVAPNGYALAAPISLTLNSEGKIASAVDSSAGKVSGDQLILMVFNEPTVTGSLSITKIDGNSGDTLPDAEFRLYYTENGENYYYALDGNGDIIWVDDVNDAEVFLSDESGKITITGLPYNVYSIEEILQPAGYMPPVGVTEIAISSDLTEVTIENKKNHGLPIILPSTVSSAALKATKVLTGRDLNEGEFSFTLCERNEDGTVSDVRTVTNNANGEIVFDDVSYDTAGVYTYIISEDAGNLSGVTYDQATHTVIVDVADDENGILTASVTYPKGGVVFENVYSDIGNPIEGDNVIDDPRIRVFSGDVIIPVEDENTSNDDATTEESSRSRDVSTGRSGDGSSGGSTGGGGGSRRSGGSSSNNVTPSNDVPQTETRTEAAAEETLPSESIVTMFNESSQTPLVETIETTQEPISVLESEPSTLSDFVDMSASEIIHPSQSPEGYTATRIDDDTYIIYDAEGVPLGYIIVPEGLTLDDIDILSEMIPLGAFNIKENPVTGNSVRVCVSLLIVSVLLLLSAEIVLIRRGRSKKRV